MSSDKSKCLSNSDDTLPENTVDMEKELEKQWDRGKKEEKEKGKEILNNTEHHQQQVKMQITEQHIGQEQEDRKEN